MSLAGRMGMLIARKWIGGITVSDAIAASRRINGMKMKVTINYLGEDFTRGSDVRKAVETYLSLLARMKAEGIEGSIAVKPTQLGLGIDYGTFMSNYDAIAKSADRLGIFVWLDMEGYTYVDDTIRAYLSELVKHRNLGICLQAKLLRTIGDVRAVARRKGIIRLVKGAYPNRSGITYADKSSLDSDYLRCMRYLFKNSRRFMIATHDDKMIGEARRLERQSGKKTIFGMLKGIRPRLAARLASEGEELYIYVPFGEEWIRYSARRLKELEHAVLVIRSVMGG